MHGTIMLLLFATPIVFAFANYIVPLQIGAPGRGVPAAERVRLLALPVRRHARGGRLPHPGGAADFGWFAYTPLSSAENSPGRRRRHVGRRPGHLRPGHDPRRGQHDHHDPDPARARHDHVPDADLHLEHPGHQPAGDHGLPDPGRRAARARRRPACSARTSSTRPPAARCSGSTCSGSSAIPRSTSSRCRSSASSPRSSRSSAASRSSATRAWSPRPSRIAALSMSVWAHHMFATGQVLLPFFAS